MASFLSRTKTFRIHQKTAFFCTSPSSRGTMTGQRTCGGLTNGTFPPPAMILTSPPSLVDKWYLGKPRYELDHCLVQQPPWTDKRCQLEYSPWILWTCSVSNLIKVLVMVSIWLAARKAAASKGGRCSIPEKEQPLCTLGDAIASFMREPDDTTKGMSTATRHDFQASMFSGKSRRSKKPSIHVAWPRQWYPGSNKWRHAVSSERWLWFFVV